MFSHKTDEENDLNMDKTSENSTSDEFPKRIHNSDLSVVSKISEKSSENGLNPFKQNGLSKSGEAKIDKKNGTNHGHKSSMGSFAFKANDGSSLKVKLSQKIGSGNIIDINQITSNSENAKINSKFANRRRSVETNTNNKNKNGKTDKK